MSYVIVGRHKDISTYPEEIKKSVIGQESIIWDDNPYKVVKRLESLFFDDYPDESPAFIFQNVPASLSAAFLVISKRLTPSIGLVISEIDESNREAKRETFVFTDGHNLQSCLDAIKFTNPNAKVISVENNQLTIELEPIKKFKFKDILWL